MSDLKAHKINSADNRVIGYRLTLDELQELLEAKEAAWEIKQTVAAELRGEILGLKTAIRTIKNIYKGDSDE